MEAVLIGGAVGVGFQQLYNCLVTAVSTTSKIKFELKCLKIKVQKLNRKFEAVAELLVQIEKEFPEEISKLEMLLEKARNLVSACSEVSRFNYYKQYKYMKRLAELDASFEQMVKVDFATMELQCMVQVLVNVGEMNKKLDGMFGKNDDVVTNDDHYEMGIPVIREDKPCRCRPKFQMSYFRSHGEKNFHLHFW
ncbi:hypothetical protein M5689_012581 [Euphorbia peplus]|nr:hypothetical protein M5689_012581 [Euphorbia peplus]